MGGAEESLRVCWPTTVRLFARVCRPCCSIHRDSGSLGRFLDGWSRGSGARTQTARSGHGPAHDELNRLEVLKRLREDVSIR